MAKQIIRMVSTNQRQRGVPGRNVVTRTPKTINAPRVVASVSTRKVSPVAKGKSNVKKVSKG